MVSALQVHTTETWQDLDLQQSVWWETKAQSLAAASILLGCFLELSKKRSTWKGHAASLIMLTDALRVQKLAQVEATTVSPRMKEAGILDLT